MSSVTMLKDLTSKGEKRPLTIQLYDTEFKVLETLREKYKCSRAAVVGALLTEYAKLNLSGKVPTARQKNVASRRR